MPSKPEPNYVLLEEIGSHSRDGSIELLICGQPYTALAYDWYIFHALDELAKHCYSNNVVKYKTITYDFVIRFRMAIRENHQHSHELEDENFESLAHIKSFIRAIELIEKVAHWR